MRDLRGRCQGDIRHDDADGDLHHDQADHDDGRTDQRRGRGVPS